MYDWVDVQVGCGMCCSSPACISQIVTIIQYRNSFIQAAVSLVTLLYNYKPYTGLVFMQMTQLSTSLHIRPQLYFNLLLSGPFTSTGAEVILKFFPPWIACILYFIILEEGFILMFLWRSLIIDLNLLIYSCTHTCTACLNSETLSHSSVKLLNSSSLHHYCLFTLWLPCVVSGENHVKSLTAY